MQSKSGNTTINDIFSGIQPGKKILFATVPADGHFNPLTGLAHHLQEQGYDIAWYCSESYAVKLSKLGIKHYPFVKAMEITGTTIEEKFPERNKIKSKIKKLNFDIINFFIGRSEEYYEDIRSIHKKFPFDMMVADVAFSAVPFVTDKLNIPVITIGVFPLTETSKDLPPTGLGMHPSYSIAGKIKQGFLRLVADKFLFSEANKVMRNILNKNGILHDDRNMFDLIIKKSSLVLQSGTPGFEYFRSDLGNNIRFIGSLLPYSEKLNKEQWFDKRLNQYERIILVTQGTVEKDIEKLIVPTLTAFKDTSTLVIATTGGSCTRELRMRFPQRNIIIEDFIAFDDIMPYADVYITNGGYGGVMLAIENKLPLICAGVHEGKNEINARVGYFNLGIDLKTEVPSPEQLFAAVEEVLRNKNFKKNVIQLGEEFAGYDPYRLSQKYIGEVLQFSKNLALDLKRKISVN